MLQKIDIRHWLHRPFLAIQWSKIAYLWKLLLKWLEVSWTDINFWIIKRTKLCVCVGGGNYCMRYILSIRDFFHLLFVQWRLYKVDSWRHWRVCTSQELILPNFFPSKMDFFLLFANKFCHFYCRWIIFLCYKAMKPNIKNRKTKKNEVWQAWLTLGFGWIFLKENI